MMYKKFKVKCRRNYDSWRGKKGTWTETATKRTWDDMYDYYAFQDIEILSAKLIREVN